MKNWFCRPSSSRTRWAVSLCYAAATLLGLEALHPSATMWLGLSPDQGFNLSAYLATLAVFLGTLLSM